MRKTSNQPQVIGFHDFHTFVPVVSAPKGTMAIMNKGWKEQRGMNHGSNEVAVEKAGAWSRIAEIAAEAYEKREGMKPMSLTPCYVFVQEEGTDKVCGAHVYISRGRVCWCG